MQDASVASMVDRSDLSSFASSLLNEAGEIAVNLFYKNLPNSAKGSTGNILSQADTMLNDFIISRIKREYPDHSIYSEEISPLPVVGDTPVWVVGPLDGTRNFVNRIGYWCIMLALIDSNRIVFGAIHDPFQRKTYYACKGFGLFVNGQRVLSGPRPSNLAQSLGIAVVDPSGVHFSKYHMLVSRLLKETGWIHNHGSMLSAVHVAEGGLSFLVNNYGYLYDYAASVIICREAGLLVTNSNGNEWSFCDRDLVIAPAELHTSIMMLM